MIRKTLTTLTLLTTAPAIFADTIAPTGGAQPGEFNFGSIGLLVVFIGVFYFLMIRPQMKRNKEHRNLLSQLAKGDEVVTTGGILGKVAEVGDTFIELTVAENVVIKVQKPAVASVMPKGTLKSAS